MKTPTESIRNLAISLINCDPQDLDVLYAMGDLPIMYSSVFCGWLQRLVGDENRQRESDLEAQQSGAKLPDMQIFIPDFGSLPETELANMLQDITAVHSCDLTEKQRDVFNQLLRLISIEVCARLRLPAAIAASAANN